MTYYYLVGLVYLVGRFYLVRSEVLQVQVHQCHFARVTLIELF
jgi:hypothetical protein